MITVIVPIYKVESYLDRCVRSIINQTYKDLEIILIDDGSPDNCPAMCDSWREQDVRIHVIHKKNGGLSDARNSGLRIASGDYIAFVDSDDWIAPEMFERLISAINQDHSDIAACTVQLEGEGVPSNQFLTVQTNCVLNRQEAQKALLEESLLKNPVWYKLYRRRTIQDVFFDVGKYHEDVFWSYQVIGNASRVSLIDYVGYFYTQRTESIMGTPYSLKRLDAMEAYERRYHFIAEFFPELETQARVNMVANCIYHGQMALKYLSRYEQKEVFIYLNDVKRRYPVKRKEYSHLKITHRLWIDCARLSLEMVCTIKNLIRVGL